MEKRPKNAQAKSGCLRGLTQKLLKNAPALTGAGRGPSTAGSGLRITKLTQAIAMAAANKAYANVSEEARYPATTMPIVPPAVMPAPTNPLTVPRSSSGKRSATIVVSAACIELSDAPASTQKNVIVKSVCICDAVNNEIAPTTEPHTIQGVRLPHRVRVRSDKAPASGVMHVLNTEVIANTIARSRALFAGSIA